MKEEDWLAKWEEELPSPEELMPLTQNLITPDLAAAFKIHTSSASASAPTESGSVFPGSGQQQQRPGGEPPKRIELEEEESSVGGVTENVGEEPARTLKRPRLVWTPQLHKRFVDAVAHLGIKNAVPKTIMQLMNVEGLTRENVASHLQKYRLYLKRMQGLSSEGPSACDQLFASTPVPPSHFLHRDDMVVPLVPMGIGVPGLSHGHMVAGPPHYGGFDPRFLTTLSRQQQQQQQPPPPQRLAPSAATPRGEYVMVEDLSSTATPPRQVLTLFPTGDN